ncbi:MAG TPA: YeeE/YedE family protein [Alphaproteobacteria bacterium]
MENFTPVSALIGGALIGAAASMLLLLNGRIAGISGILGGLLPPERGDALWRILFLLGLPVGVALWRWLGDPDAGLTITSSVPILIAGGLLVGLGSRIGGGCTSGHGVCGLARLSRRSLVATGTFMAAAFATVFVSRHLIGGG